VGVSTDTTMTKPIDPNELTRDERIRELASILARGLTRLLDAASFGVETSPKEPQLPLNEP
jgi:hypothetical protein